MPYSSCERKYVYSGTKKKVISLVATVLSVNRPRLINNVLYLPIIVISEGSSGSSEDLDGMGHIVKLRFETNTGCVI